MMNIPKKDKARWVILSFSVFLLFGSYYCFELPAALKDSLEIKFSKHLSADEYEYFFNSLFSIYSLPNIVLPFLNGYLIDRMGLRKVLFTLVLLVAVGQVFFAFTISIENFTLMIFARFIFGIGSESLFVAENILLTKYFRGKELSFAIGLNLAVANLGGVLNMYLTPRFAYHFGTSSAVWIGAILCIFSFICIIVVLYVDSKLSQGSLSPTLIGRNQVAEYNTKNLKIQDFSRLEPTFWYLALTGFFLYACIISWINVGPSFLIDKWFQDIPLEQAQIKAGNCLSLMWLSAVISGPLIGYFVDNYGFRLKVLIFGAILSTICMVTLFFIYPILPSILMGLSYSFGVASIYPSVPHIVPLEYLGKANGIVTSMQNLGFFIYPYAIAGLKVGFGDYTYAQYFLIGSTLMAILFSILANIANSKRGYQQSLEETQKNTDDPELEIHELKELKFSNFKS